MRRLAILMTVLLAGCMGDSSSKVDLVPMPSNPTAVTGFEVDGCAGWHTFVELPAEAVGASAPDGWAREFPTTDVEIEAWACESLTIGGQTFHDTFLLMEVHDYGTTPLDCFDRDDYNSAEVVEQIWSDENEVVALLQRDLHMPTRLGTATVNPTTGPVQGETWTFETAGHPASMLEFRSIADTSGPGVSWHHLRVWENPLGGVSAMSYRVRDSFAYVGNPLVGGVDWPAATGALRDPFLHLPGSGTYVSTSLIRQIDVHAEARVRHYSDTLCQQPEPV